MYRWRNVVGEVENRPPSFIGTKGHVKVLFQNSSPAGYEETGVGGKNGEDHIGRVMVVMRNNPEGNKWDLKTNQLAEMKEK